MLTTGSQPLSEFAPEWRNEASSYLDTCKKLFPEEHERRKRLEFYQEACVKFGLENVPHILVKWLFLILFEDFNTLYSLADNKCCLDILLTGITRACVEEILEKYKQGAKKEEFSKVAKLYYVRLKEWDLDEVLSRFRTNVLLQVNDSISEEESSSLSKEKCLASVGVALFEEFKECKGVIQALTESLEKNINEFSSGRWTQAFLDACISERPSTMVAGVYFFNLIYRGLISDNPTNLDFLIAKCREYFNQDNMDMLVGKVFEWVIDKGSNKDVSTHIQRALSLSKVYSDTHTNRKLIEEFSQYTLLQENNQQGFVRIAFKLLQSSTSLDPMERIKCRKEIEELLLKDTVESNVVSSENAKHNLDVVRKVLHEIPWKVTQSERVPRDIKNEVGALLSKTYETFQRYATQKVNQKLAQEKALQEIATYGMNYTEDKIRTQITVTDRSGKRLWHKDKNLIGTKVTDTPSNAFEMESGEFIRTVVRPWRETLWQYCRFPGWNYYIFVEGDWYPYGIEKTSKENTDRLTLTNPKLITIIHSSRREGNRTHFRIRIEGENQDNERAAWGGVTINVPTISSKDVLDNTKIQAWSIGSAQPFWRLPGETIFGFLEDDSFGQKQAQCLFVESVINLWKQGSCISLEVALTTPLTSLEAHVRTWATWKKTDGGEKTDGDPSWRERFGTGTTLDQQRIPAYQILIG